MAGVTDRPFRQLCRRHGAALAASEMVISDPAFRDSTKSRRRVDFAGEASPRVVQIAGAEPAMMAEAARYHTDQGAEIIDINMGCPAKKVCRRAAGSALLRDEALVAAILQAVVAATPLPVTLKFRTGWSPEQRNGVRIARIAEDAGIKALAVHGRTRACAYGGEAEYDTIADIVRSVTLPVFANGDIDSPQKAAQVLDYTGAAGVMIGRGAHGRPWLFAQINHYLATGELLPEPDMEQRRAQVLEHLQALYAFYGEALGLRIARKHVGWYAAAAGLARPAVRIFHQLTDSRAQLRCAAGLFAAPPALDPSSTPEAPTIFEEEAA
jgi:tRNA-dihydrouridine synthase B